MLLSSSSSSSSLALMLMAYRPCSAVALARSLICDFRTLKISTDVICGIVKLRAALMILRTKIFTRREKSSMIF